MNLPGKIWDILTPRIDDIADGKNAASMCNMNKQHSMFVWIIFHVSDLSELQLNYAKVRKIVEITKIKIMKKYYNCKYYLQEDICENKHCRLRSSNAIFSK